MNKTLIVVASVLPPSGSGLDLAELLAQHDGLEVCIEARPFLDWNRATAEDASDRLEARIDRLMAASCGPIVADISVAYFPYLARIIRSHPEVKILIATASIDHTRDVYAAWFGSQPLPYNYWAESEGRGVFLDPDFGRQYPTFPETEVDRSLECHLSVCNQLVQGAVRLAGDRVHCVDIGQLHQHETAAAVLEFVGIPKEQILLDSTVIDRQDPPIAADRRQPGSEKDCVVIVPHSSGITTQTEEGLQGLEEQGYTVWRRGGVSAIDQGRSLLATEAVLQGYRELMWIDSDIKFDPDDVKRLRDHQLPFVSGIYPKKGMRALASNVAPGTATLRFGSGGGLVNIDFAAAGFMLVRRDALIRMIGQLQLLVCNESFSERVVFPFFLPLVVPHGDAHWYLGEDFAFSYRLKQCGVPIVADTSIRLWHVGSYEYGWEDAGSDVKRFSSYDFHLS